MEGLLWRELFAAVNEISQEITLNNIPDPVISETTEEGVPIRKLFIGNLAERTTNKDLQKLFSNYGKVNSCYIKRNNGKNNFAFITFNDVEGGIKAREAASRMEIQMHCRILRVSSANSWHQPDSVENQRRFLKNKSDDSDDSIKVHEFIEPDFNESPIHILNDDCLMEIFLYLPIADRIRTERVCKRWQAVSQESWRAVKSLDLKKNTWGLTLKIRIRAVDTTTLRKVLIRCGQYLTNLDLSQYPHLLSSSTLTIVGKFCPNLQCINIKALELSPSGIYSLMNNCQSINKLTIKSLTGPCEKDLSQLFNVNKKLKYLAVDGDGHISGKCLEYLPENIEEIHFNCCLSLVSNHFNLALQKFNNLHSLTLNSCVCITDSTLETIGEIKTIINLEFSGSNPMISAISMNNLAKLINLQQLCVSQNLAVTDEFLINISNKCKKLKSLDISYCGAVTNKGIIAIATLTELEILKIKWLIQITDEAIENLHSIKVLECWGCTNIRDRGVIKLIEMAPNLRKLDLSGCSITNEAIKAAISITLKRTNNLVLQMIVGGNETNLQELYEISPWLLIINVDLSLLGNINT
ncbi:hypothetical protein PV327_003265 [Microctonus hyperodae]|uniref:Uncharacterized protein n=1 Tax=Microctonus hyperodae TaxID=165561 RepID=A0AA39G456_MICHY|nr:hypothetical protein PV327_003265 [Microctonus hyperodae]